MGGLNAARRCSSSHEGFTLIEVMVALVILGAGMLAMLAVQIQAIQGGGCTQHSEVLWVKWNYGLCCRALPRFRYAGG